MYEAHMTFSGLDRDRVKSFAVEYALTIAKGWSYSEIAGDPHMGDGIKCYLTKHADGDDYNYLLQDMIKRSTELAERGVGTLRMKIERIVFDTKTGILEPIQLHR